MDDIAFLENASASFQGIAENGRAASPLPFERAEVGLAERVDAAVYNPVTHEMREVSNIIYGRRLDGRPPERAYWIGRKLKKCIFGVVKSCTILKCRNDYEVPWEVTEHRAAVKIMSWQKIRRIRHIEDPEKEVAAMQHVAFHGEHPHVMAPLDLLQDEDYLLVFMPYCSSGDLFQFVQQAGRFQEPMARWWFRQILDGVGHLQRMGVCHRDMSLENLMVDEYKRTVIIDLGMCLRVPFAANNGGITDVSAGTLRLLIKPLIPCGKPNYISPEIFRSREPFDGFGIDLWGLGVILFIMLVGLPPWECATEADPRYRLVMQGGLERMLHSWERPVSPAAMDLLQRMLNHDPRQRLSLIEIRDHAWVLNEISEAAVEPAPREGWRR